MSDNSKDFDRKAERDEEREDDKFSAKLCVEELTSIKMDRCCVYVKDPDELRVLHGKMLGMMVELDSLILRDLRPGREALQTKRLVPMANVDHLCTSVSLEKCQGCDEYQEMLREHAACEAVRGTRSPKKESAK